MSEAPHDRQNLLVEGLLAPQTEQTDPCGSAITFFSSFGGCAAGAVSSFGGCAAGAAMAAPQAKQNLPVPALLDPQDGHTGPCPCGSAAAFVSSFGGCAAGAAIAAPQAKQNFPVPALLDPHDGHAGPDGHAATVFCGACAMGAVAVMMAPQDRQNLLRAAFTDPQAEHTANCSPEDAVMPVCGVGAYPPIAPCAPAGMGAFPLVVPLNARIADNPDRTAQPQKPKPN